MIVNFMIWECLGGRFTWEKGHGTEAWVEERLDRAVATMDWVELYEDAAVRKVFIVESDHSAILLDLETRPIRSVRYSFKFESAWLLDAGCAKVVESAWSQTIGLDFQQRIGICGQQLRGWGGDHARKFGNRIKLLRHRLAELKENRSVQAVREFLEAEIELENLLRQEELFWLQRSKQLWLKHGEANNKFFHKAASARRSRNTLLRIKD
ncbi:PREDICTED: uncharacterized protein LOC109162410 [Ipomoea nil]|uniref:uncharacterized protein LOC109162410 n=1 Tax=Ipomoea nil TaxID=35883 RepID=UPI0009008BCA|nr:PREDICTED: uncharacterized protein LOC109162410 [Ipomoea nil]